MGAGTPCTPDERIRALEISIHRLQEHMSGVRDEVHVISKTLYTKVRSLFFIYLFIHYRAAKHLLRLASFTGTTCLAKQAACQFSDDWHLWPLLSVYESSLATHPIWLHSATLSRIDKRRIRQPVRLARAQSDAAHPSPTRNHFFSR